MQSTLAQFNEIQASEAFSLQNAKLVRVRLDQVRVQARRGSVVAHQGEIALDDGAGEGFVRLSGTGTAFVAARGREVHLVKLDAEAMTVGHAHLLAADAGIGWEAGEHGIRLEGTGFLALVSDGPPVLLDVAAAETGARLDAAIAWSEDVTAEAVRASDVPALAFAGQGWVLVQPSAG